MKHSPWIARSNSEANVVYVLVVAEFQGSQEVVHGCDPVE